MPKRTDISSILIIGAGPIVIGQACEFDYSGTQAVKTLKAEGYRVILVNSNPATIMTDPELADATYIEPILPEFVEKIIAKERPDALLPTMGGQTALNCAKALAESGILEKYGVELIGADLAAINKAEDRGLFNEAMARIGLETPKNALAHTMAEARAAVEKIGLPVIIRPSFTMGGAGGGVAYNMEEFEQIAASGLDASPTTEILIDESVLGWKEYEMEVVRDKNDNCIIVCSIENIDPMGVHTGDSITVAPALTLTDKEYQIMRDASIAVLREIGVETGGSNVQFAVNPENGRMIVIEMNPRVSRSSALASKATGFPIAKVAAKLAVGYTLDEVANDVVSSKKPSPSGRGETLVRVSGEGYTSPNIEPSLADTALTPRPLPRGEGAFIPASFEPTIDYVVTKIPRFAFEKFPAAPRNLTTAMKSVGEAMAMGRCFAESMQKALRSLETGLTGFNEREIPEGADAQDIIMTNLSNPTPDRILWAAEALRRGFTVEEICGITNYDPWLIRQIEEIINAEEQVRGKGLPADIFGMLELKKLGFSDLRLAQLCGKKEAEITAHRHALGVRPVFKRIDTCAGEFAAITPYLYSCYEGDGITPPRDEANPTDREKIIILGGGPNRIGQGIEFDYCCVHACYALSDAGYETIMINCNPETVSTDYDTSDRLYFEPLTAEDVIEIIQREQTNGSVKGALVQFGGQTPLKLAHALEAAGIPIIGTTPDSIDLAEDRERFQQLLQRLGLRQPENAICHTPEEVIEMSGKMGFPVVVRPSYVLGGRGMAIIHEAETLKSYVTQLYKDFHGNAILIDSFLTNAAEVDVDALCDGEDVYVAGIMEHIEEAGIHSGDSSCSLPPYSLSREVMLELKKQTEQLALALKVVGLINIQFAIKDGDIYILEVNPRASRTVPFVAKTIGLPVAKIAARLMAGEKLKSFNLPPSLVDRATPLGHTAVKEAVFPFERFANVDVLLGPEMKSTGESMGLDVDFAHAFGKAHLGSGAKMPKKGPVFVSVRDSDKDALVTICRDLLSLGFSLIATSGTQKFLSGQGIDVALVNKVRQGRPHIVDFLKDGKVAFVINTTEGAKSIEDSFSIRRTALQNKIPYSTTLEATRAIVQALRVIETEGGFGVRALQEYVMA